VKLVRLLAAALLVTSAATTTGLASTNDSLNASTANEPPLADAGLDQSVTRGTTVYLDAGESRDPDGSIVDYRWTITHESEDVTTTTPECRDCEQTRFQPETTGTYNVTLEVTDDDQATSTDSLLVEVKTGEPPSVTLSSASQTSTGDATRFTADVTGGAAPLSELVWNVDGERVATEPLSGSANTTTHTTRFPTTGTHTVSVVAIDEDDQQDVATREITVTEPPSSDDPDSNSDNSSETDGPAPDVTGPRVVTGHGTLDADYELTDGESGAWMLDGAQTGTGSSTSVSLSPGVHELYAATDDGVATFADGNRNVVADPAPELSVGNLSDESVVPVDIHVTDDFGNLRSVTVEVDGEPVETYTVEQVGGQRAGRSLSTVEYLDSLDPGSHAVTVRARDARGQTTVRVRTVTVPGPPEVVSAGFVEDGPLDQYHPHINQSRYTATYRVKVKLNGVAPEAVQSWIDFGDNYWVSETVRSEGDESDLLILEKRTFRDELGSIVGRSSIRWRQTQHINSTEDQIDITPAPPEIRVSPFSYQNRKVSGKGIGLDASDSFDPDGTELGYTWYNAQGEDVEDPKVFLDTFDYTYLEVEDRSGQATESGDLLSWLVPKLQEASFEQDGPSYPNETVTFTVWSEQYLLTKPTYENLTSFALRANQGTVTNSTLLRNAPDGVNEPDTLYFPRWNRWTVEVPARAFLERTPTVSSYGTDHPVVQHDLELPEPDVYIPTSSTIENVTVDVEYRVKRPDQVMRQTTNEDVRDSLLTDGYAVEATSKSGYEYELEEFVKVQDAQYDIDQKQFDRDGRRQYYLSLNPDWERAGTNTETRIWTTTEDVWRSDRDGDGTYTGETRRKLVEEGTYRTEKQYEYETTETYQTTISYQDTYTTTEIRVSYEEKCSAFGCFKYRTTTTETVQHTVTRTKTVTRTRTVDRQYWSSRPRDSSHDYTGRTRRITVSEPEYERQYKFEVERQHSETNRVYLAEHRTLVQPTSFSWQGMSTVSSRVQAETAAMAQDVRIGNVVPAKQWTLTNRDGSETVRVDSLDQDWTVLETIGEGEATLVQQYIRDGEKRLANTRTQEFEISADHSEPGLISKEEIRNIITEKLEEKSNA
jgi:hypothetical protein